MMPLLADLDGTGWALIITAGCVGFGGIVTGALTLILAFRTQQASITREDAREAARIERDRVAEEKAEVREKAKVERDKKIDEKVEVIHLATNSMKDALMAKTEDEALARGELKARDKIEAKSEAKEAAAAVVAVAAPLPLAKPDVTNVQRAAIDAIKGVAQAVAEVPQKTADLVDENADKRNKGA